MSQHVTVRLPDTLRDDVDALVASGAYPSRSAALRAAVEAFVELEQRRRIDIAIVKGYTLRPPTEDEDRSALASLREAILEEPWL